MSELFIPEFSGNLRKHRLSVPKVISNASGISIFGKLIKSIVFTTDVAIIRNVNADAVIAVYPFTPQPIITHSLMLASNIPVFAGVGGGTTNGKRVANLALDAEFQGAIGVVVNAPIPNEDIEAMSAIIDIPIVVTIVSHKDDVDARLRAGASILNVSASAKTPDIVRKIRSSYPEAAIIATGGPTDASIAETIAAGANAITWTPPSNGEIFKGMMNKYRNAIDNK